MSRSRWVVIAKLILAGLLVAAVGWYFVKLLRQPELHAVDFVIRLEYLIPAGLLYLLAHTIWGTFWVQLLRGQGVELPWLIGVRAYFVSQFGKYVPGKAWVIFLRMGLLRGRTYPAVIAVTATYETLTSMAAGAFLGVCFLPWAGTRFGEGFGGARWWGLAGLATLPIGVALLHRLTARIAKKYRAPDARPLAVPSMRLLARGLVQNAFGWLALALSLALTVRGTLGERGPLLLIEYLQDLAAVSLSYVAGFLLLVSPGGRGAREFVLQTILVSQFQGSPAAAGLAAVVALMLRLIWTVAEVVVAGSMWLAVRPSDLHNGKVPNPGATPTEATVSP